MVTTGAWPTSHLLVVRMRVAERKSRQGLRVCCACAQATHCVLIDSKMWLQSRARARDHVTSSFPSASNGSDVDFSSIGSLSHIWWQTAPTMQHRHKSTTKPLEKKMMRIAVDDRCIPSSARTEVTSTCAAVMTAAAASRRTTSSKTLPREIRIVIVVREEFIRPWWRRPSG